jgi:hypothetical protein
MLSDFRVQNLRGLNDLRLTDLARVNIVTGLNNVGKSALLEALWLFACGPNAGTGSLLLANLRGRVALIPAGQLETMSSTWNWLFRDRDWSQPIVLTGALDGMTTTVTLELRTHEFQRSLVPTPEGPSESL